MSNEMFSEREINASRAFAYFEWLATMSGDKKAEKAILGFEPIDAIKIDAIKRLKTLLSENSQPIRGSSDSKEEVGLKFQTQIKKLEEAEQIIEEAKKAQAQSRSIDEKPGATGYTKAQDLLVELAEDKEIIDFMNDYKKKDLSTGMLCSLGVRKIALLNHADKALQQVFLSSQPKRKATLYLMGWVALFGLGIGGFVFGAPNQAADVASHMAQLFTGKTEIIAASSVAALVFAALLITAAYCYYKHKELEVAAWVLQETPDYKAITQEFDQVYKVRARGDIQKHDHLMLQALEVEAYCLEKLQAKFHGGLLDKPKVLRQDFVNRVCWFILQSADKQQRHEAFSLLNGFRFWGTKNQPAYKVDDQSELVLPDQRIRTSKTMSLLGEHLYLKDQEECLRSLDEEIAVLKKTKLYSTSTGEDSKEEKDKTNTLVGLITSQRGNEGAISYLTHQSSEEMQGKDTKDTKDSKTVAAMKEDVLFLKALKSELDAMEQYFSQNEKLDANTLETFIVKLESLETDCKEKMQALSTGKKSEKIADIEGLIWSLKKDMSRLIDTIKDPSSTPGFDSLSEYLRLYKRCTVGSLSSLNKGIRGANQELEARLNPYDADIANIKKLQVLEKSRDDIRKLLGYQETDIENIRKLEACTEKLAVSTRKESALDKQCEELLTPIHKNQDHDPESERGLQRTRLLEQGAEASREVWDTEEELGAIRKQQKSTTEADNARDRLIAHLQRHYDRPRAAGCNRSGPLPLS